MNTISNNKNMFSILENEPTLTSDSVHSPTGVDDFPTLKTAGQKVSNKKKYKRNQKKVIVCSTSIIQQAKSKRISTTTTTSPTTTTSNSTLSTNTTTSPTTNTSNSTSSTNTTTSTIKIRSLACKHVDASKNGGKYGQCSFGLTCTFAHSLEELDHFPCRNNIDCYYKTSTCKFIHSDETPSQFRTRTQYVLPFLPPHNSTKYTIIPKKPSISQLAVQQNKTVKKVVPLMQQFPALPKPHQSQIQSPPQDYQQPQPHQSQIQSPPQHDQQPQPHQSQIQSPQDYQQPQPHQSQIQSPPQDYQQPQPHQSQIQSPPQDYQQPQPHQSQIQSPPQHYQQPQPYQFQIQSPPQHDQQPQYQQPQSLIHHQTSQHYYQQPQSQIQSPQPQSTTVIRVNKAMAEMAIMAALKAGKTDIQLEILD
jgi:hypothetical protein